MEKRPSESTQFISTPIAILCSSIIISMAILISGGVIQIKGLTSGSVKAGQVAQVPTVPSGQAAAPAPENTGPVKVSVDDDPVLGDVNAPVTLVEFSDYECPFCKRHFDQTYVQLKKDYIDTGKVKLVYRDLPLSFHDPLATKQAIAANCAREQGSDETYFKMHDEIFKTTTSNGSGMTMDQLYGLAGTIGIDQAAFKSCIDADKYKEEVAKDLADAGAAGATGTPSFVIGKSTDSGEIEGQLLVGAQPFAAFKTIIDEKLSN
jgi:protein-disulfide isomerase